MQPAVGLTALHRLLVPSSAPAAVVLSPLLLPAFLVPPARGSSFYGELSSLQSPARPSQAAGSAAVPHQQQQQRAPAAGQPQAEDVLSVLTDIVRGVLGQSVAADQPLMEVCLLHPLTEDWQLAEPKGARTMLLHHSQEDGV